MPRTNCAGRLWAKLPTTANEPVFRFHNTRETWQHLDKMRCRGNGSVWKVQQKRLGDLSGRAHARLRGVEITAAKKRENNDRKKRRPTIARDHARMGATRGLGRWWEVPRAGCRRRLGRPGASGLQGGSARARERTFHRTHGLFFAELQAQKLGKLTCARCLATHGRTLIASSAQGGTRREARGYNPPSAVAAPVARRARMPPSAAIVHGR
jgi:hypothetical protein